MRNPVRMGVGVLRRAVDAVDRLSRGAQLSGMNIEVGAGARLRSAGVTPQPSCSLVVGAESLVDGSIAFERPHATIAIGQRTFMNGRLIAAERITVGDDVLMAWGVTVVDHDSHSLAFSRRADDVRMWARGEKDWSHVTIRPVSIGARAWIGFDAVILKGVTIGEGAVVAARAVVTRNVDPWTVVAGNPARVIRQLGEHER
jgi:acetyltransferase-like isoleucine patch superfamily enzyme